MWSILVESKLLQYQFKSIGRQLPELRTGIYWYQKDQRVVKVIDAAESAAFAPLADLFLMRAQRIGWP